MTTHTLSSMYNAVCIVQYVQQSSLIPRPSLVPVFDHLSVEGLGRNEANNNQV